MEKITVISIIIVVIALIAFLVYFFSAKTIILRRLKKLRFSKIGSLQNHHYSKVEGNALNVNQPLIAPLSKRECVFYQILIENLQKKCLDLSEIHLSKFQNANVVLMTFQYYPSLQ